ncbi:hypothetical protein [Nocardia sp. NPDC050793]|uniref:hypothetical protein n=1 Tax=Nocardia sp. NPDC050793 TaxID=3155159 RepID=UPI0033D870F3
MGLSDEMSLDDTETPQQSYCARVCFLRRYTLQALAQFTAGGPPPRVKADGARGLLLWHERHVPTVEEFARLLAQMEAEGLLSVVNSSACTQPSADTVASLKALVSESGTAQARRHGAQS